MSLYGQIYTRKRTQVLEQQNFLKGGLGKLAEAAVTVDTLSVAAEKQRVVLRAKQAEADEALVHIQDSMLKVRRADGGRGAVWGPEAACCRPANASLCCHRTTTLETSCGG